MIQQPPVCGCGAGVCRLDAVAVGGPNFGRKFYACPIKKGQGACSFFLWQDGGSSVASSALNSVERVLSPVPTLTDFTTISPSDSGLVTKGQQNASYSSVNESSLKSGEHVLISPVSSTNVINISPDVSHDVPEIRPNDSVQGNAFESQGSNNRLLKSALLKRSNIRFEEPRECEDKFDEPLTRQSKRLRQGNFDGGSISLHLVPLENSRNGFSSGSSELMADSHHEETTGLTVTAYDNLLSSCQSSSSLLIDFEIFQHSCWTLAEMGETLRNQVHGWWGRLAFPPSKCLTEPAQKPYFCCVFPSFNPIFVPQNVYQLKEAADPPAELISSQGNIRMQKFASKALTKAALQLQTDLLRILRPLDIKDHETMTHEANTAFSALDRLGTDHKKFREQVTEFIQNASLLATIDQSISTDRSCEKHSDRLNRKKQRLTEIKDAQERFTGALSVSTQRATRLAEEISGLKDKLRQAEAELCCCSSESAALKALVSQISRDRAKSERSMKKTHDRLKDSLRIRKVMEAEKLAAKAAFDKAKTVLFRSDYTTNCLYNGGMQG